TEENKNMSIKDLINARLKEAQPRRDTAENDSATTEPQPVPADTLSNDVPALDSATVQPLDSIAASTFDSTAVQPDSTIALRTPTEPVQEEQKPNVVNTDYYVFEDEVVQQNQPSESFLTRYRKAREKSRITGPFPYESKFSSNNLVTSFVVDPIRGLGISIETQMNDKIGRAHV